MQTPEDERLSPDASFNAASYARAQEEQAINYTASTGAATHSAPKKSFGERFMALRKGKKGPILAVIGLIVGSSSLFYSLLAPGITLSHMIEVLTKDLNSSLAGMDRTHAQLMRTKLKQATAGSCGKVKIACRFKTVNVEKTRQAYKMMGIDVEFDTNKGFGAGRGRITKMTYTNPHDPKDIVTINNAAEFTQHMKRHPDFRTAVLNARSPKFLTLKNGPTMKFLAKMKTNYSKKLQGNSKKALDEDIRKATSSKVSLGGTRLSPQKDENGRETGNFVDENGKVYTPDEAKALKETDARITNAPSSSSIAKNIAKGLMVTGTADTACTVFNTSRAVSFAAKTARKADLIRYFMIFANTQSAMKSDDVTPEQVSYLSNKIAETDTRTDIVDEAKLADTPEGAPLPMRKNPHYGKSGLDAPLFKQSAYQDKPRLDITAQRFMVGGGMVGVLDKVNVAIAHALGSSSPRELTKKCGIVQNPAVRGGSLVLGVLVGLGTFGVGTAVSLAGSALFAMALPYLVAQLGDIVAGRVTGPELKGVDAVNAASVGAASMFNGVAREQGMIPLSPDKMVEYQNTNRQIEVAYEADERRLAKRHPFDIHNQFSFIGSLGRTLLPVHHAATGQAPAAIATVLPTLFGQAGKVTAPHAEATSSKISRERYEQCNDSVYAEMGVAADSSCTLLFGLPKEAMDADPVEVAEWMAANGEIDPESETGEAKDNGAKWNYAKFLEDCVKQEPGAHPDPEASRDNGYSCASPENFDKNWRYAKYTVSKTWNETLDGNTPGLDGSSQAGFTSGARGEVNPDGWSWPTTADGIITSPFGIRGGAPHNGLDIAQPGSALNKPIFAARSGKVVAAGPASGFGNWIVLQHEVDGTRYDTVYGHMYNDGVLVRQGDTVQAGQEIGKIGNNGQSTGPHLHFEVWQGGHQSFAGGRPIDPAPIVRRSGGNQ